MRAFILILLMALFATPALGAIVSFSKTHDDGTNRNVPDESTFGPNTAFNEVYFHIANLNTDDSDTFFVTNRGSINVVLNARTDAVYGTNGVTVEVCMVVSEIDTYDVDNCHIIQGTALTGGGNNGMIWDIQGPGRFWLNVTAGPTTGAALVVIKPFIKH